MERTPEIVKYLELLDDHLGHAGYETVDIDNNLKVTTRYIGPLDSGMMPIIEINVVEEDGYWYSMPKLTFPVLDANDYDYYDSIHYWLDNWTSVGVYMTYIIKDGFAKDEYLEDLANGEY